MTTNEKKFSKLTTILPNSIARETMTQIVEEMGVKALVWKARGTLLYDSWWKRFIPPISPVKTVSQMILPEDRAKEVVQKIVEYSNLHKQAIGAVFNNPCERTIIGSEFQSLKNIEEKTLLNSDKIPKDLSIIYCILPPKMSEKVAKAAINVGSHGPIIYYSEGKGLRDRLGWLRITKEAEKEVLMVLTSKNEVEKVFDAMAVAGELYLPGRGFMYSIDIDRGLFNLPSRVSQHFYTANLQQIINAIDHLAGHNHWRDQSAFSLNNNQPAALSLLKKEGTAVKNQMAVSVIAKRDDMENLMDLMLDNGAAGVNIHYAKALTPMSDDSQGRFEAEYAMLRSITKDTNVDKICQAALEYMKKEGMSDICLSTHIVPRIATYVHKGEFAQRVGDKKTAA